MNLKNNPTEQQLQRLMAKADDDACDHMVWVSKDGEVHIEAIIEDMSVLGFVEQHKTEIRFRFESYDRGNDYVGRHAAEDRRYVARLFQELMEAWASGVVDHEGCYEPA